MGGGGDGRKWLKSLFDSVGKWKHPTLLESIACTNVQANTLWLMFLSAREMFFYYGQVKPPPIFTQIDQEAWTAKVNALSLNASVSLVSGLFTMAVTLAVLQFGLIGWWWRACKPKSWLTRFDFIQPVLFALGVQLVLIAISAPEEYIRDTLSLFTIDWIPLYLLWLVWSAEGSAGGPKNRYTWYPVLLCSSATVITLGAMFLEDTLIALGFQKASLIHLSTIGNEAVRAGSLQLASRVGFPIGHAYVSTRGHGINAQTSVANVFINADTLKLVSARSAIACLAHEMGHYLGHHVLLRGVLVTLGFYVIIGLFVLFAYLVDNLVHKTIHKEGEQLYKTDPAKDPEVPEPEPIVAWTQSEQSDPDQGAAKPLSEPENQQQQPPQAVDAPSLPAIGNDRDDRKTTRAPIMVVAVFFALCAAPLLTAFKGAFMAFNQHQEWLADGFALEATRDPAAMGGLLLKCEGDGMPVPCDPLSDILSNTHPCNYRRLARILCDWNKYDNSNPSR